MGEVFLNPFSGGKPRMAVERLHIHQHQVNLLAAKLLRFKGIPDGAHQMEALVGRKQLDKVLLYVFVVLNDDEIDHRLSSSFLGKNRVRANAGRWEIVISPPEASTLL